MDTNKYNWNRFRGAFKEDLLRCGFPEVALKSEEYFSDFVSNGDFDYHDEKVDFDVNTLSSYVASELLYILRYWYHWSNPAKMSDDDFMDAIVVRDLSRYVKWNAFLLSNGPLLQRTGVPSDALRSEDAFELFMMSGSVGGRVVPFDENKIDFVTAKMLIQLICTLGYSRDKFLDQSYLGKQIRSRLISGRLP